MVLQDLTVTLVSELEATGVELVESSSMMRTICTKTISCEQEWRLHKFVNVWNKTVSKISSAENLQYPAFCCAASKSRCATPEPSCLLLCRQGVEKTTVLCMEHHRTNGRQPYTPAVLFFFTNIG